ncbi:MAG: M20 family metallopeptidase [Thermoplasmata archaeon]
MDDLAALALELIKERSENPPGDESGVADVIKSRLKRYMDLKEITKVENRVNLIFGNGSLMVFNGHMDTVPVGRNWTHNPYGEISGNIIYGRGSSDMKGALASLIVAIEEIVDKGKRDLLKRFKFAFVADEEQGGELGTKSILGELKARYGLVMEGSVFNGRICYRPGIRGTLWLRIISRGKSAHGSDPDLGENAVMNLADLLIKLKSIKIDFRKHPYLPDPTMAVGTTFHGGEKVNVIPDYAEATLDIRTIPSMDIDDLMKRIKNEIKLTGKNIDVEIIHQVHPVEIPLDSNVVVMVKKAVYDVTGKFPEPVGGKGSNDANYMISYNIETIVFGPGDFTLDNAHGSDEHISLERLITFKNIYRRIIENAKD